MNDLTMSPMYPMSDIGQMAEVMAKSRMFGFRSVEEAVSLMLIAQAEGNHPAKAAQEYHVIQGRPALKADAMMARFQRAGGTVEWEEMTDESVSAYFSHPKSCPKPVRVDWTMERAKTAKLTGKDNWQKYPRQMLKARVISEGVRMTFPGVTVGLYTPEETEDFDTNGPPKIIDHSIAANRINSRTNEVREAVLQQKVVPGVSSTPVGSDVPHVTKEDTERPVGDTKVVHSIISSVRRKQSVEAIDKLIEQKKTEYRFYPQDHKAITDARDTRVKALNKKSEKSEEKKMEHYVESLSSDDDNVPSSGEF